MISGVYGSLSILIIRFGDFSVSSSSSIILSLVVGNLVG